MTSPDRLAEDQSREIDPEPCMYITVITGAYYRFGIRTVLGSGWARVSNPEWDKWKQRQLARKAAETQKPSCCMVKNPDCSWGMAISKDWLEGQLDPEPRACILRILGPFITNPDGSVSGSGWRWEFNPEWKKWNERQKNKRKPDM